MHGALIKCTCRLVIVPGILFHRIDAEVLNHIRGNRDCISISCLRIEESGMLSSTWLFHSMETFTIQQGRRSIPRTVNAW